LSRPVLGVVLDLGGSGECKFRVSFASWSYGRGSGFLDGPTARRLFSVIACAYEIPFLEAILCAERRQASACCLHTDLAFEDDSRFGAAFGVAATGIAADVSAATLDAICVSAAIPAAANGEASDERRGAGGTAKVGAFVGTAFPVYGFCHTPFTPLALEGVSNAFSLVGHGGLFKTMPGATDKGVDG